SPPAQWQFQVSGASPVKNLLLSSSRFQQGPPVPARLPFHHRTDVPEASTAAQDCRTPSYPDIMKAFPRLPPFFACFRKSLFLCSLCHTDNTVRCPDSEVRRSAESALSSLPHFHQSVRKWLL